MKKNLSVILIFFVCLSSLSALDDYRTRVAVFPMENNTEMEEYDSLCVTMMEVLSLVLEFQKEYRVVYQEEYLQNIDKHVINEENLGLFSGINRIDNIIYGDVVATELGSFIFTLNQFDQLEGKVTMTITETAESLFDVFDTADKLTKEITGYFGDIHLGFGSLSIERDQGIGQYSVYLDGYPVRNPEKTFAKVLNGSYEVAIHQDRLLGDTVIYYSQVEVYEDQNSLITFSIPSATPEELSYFEQLKSTMLKAGRDPENIEGFISAMIDFQEKTQNIDYDPVLRNSKSRELNTAGQMATTMLDELLIKADQSFYEKRTDYDEVLEKFSYIASLIVSHFEYDAITDLGSEDSPLILPQEMLRAENGDLYVVCRPSLTTMKEFMAEFSLGELAQAEELFLTTPIAATIMYAFNSEGTLRNKIPFVEDFRWCTDTQSRLYIHPLGKKDIIVYNPGLSNPRVLPIPGFPGTEFETRDLAVSKTNIAYMFFDDDVRIFDTTFNSLETAEPDRYISREETFYNTIDGFTKKIDTWRFDHYGDIHAFSKAKTTVFKIDAQGELLSESHLAGSLEESSVWIDKLGYYYVSIPPNHIIQKYTPGGEIIAEIGRYGSSLGQFSLPAGVVVDDAGTIYVADSFNGRIQILKLTNPPILLPAVAQYGSLITRRLGRTEDAIYKLDRIDKKEIKFGSNIGTFFLGTLLTASTVGAAIGFDAASSMVVQEIESYQTAATSAAVSDARTQITIYQALELGSLIGTAPLLMLSSGLLINSFLNTSRDIYIKPLAYRNIQGQDLNMIYNLNEDRYHSLQNAKAIGLWTGTVPGVLSVGLSTAELIISILDSDGTYIPSDIRQGLRYANMGITAIPPIWSHLYAGRFSFSLFLSGLIADALMAGAYLLPVESDYFSTITDAYSIDEEILDFNRILETFTPMAGIYLMLASSGIRLAAGAFDAKYGWTLTMERNKYKVQIESRPEGEVERSSDVSFNAVPTISPIGQLGIIARISWR